MMAKRNEHELLETLLGLALISAIGFVLVISVRDQNAARAAASGSVTASQNTATVATPTGGVLGGMDAIIAGAPAALDSLFFWPGQNVVSAGIETVSGWLGTTAPGLTYEVPAVPVSSSAGARPAALANTGLSGTTAVNL